MNDATPLLEMRDVHKRYGRTHALRGISIALQPGRVYGLVGENGAGKSTLVKTMCGAVRPDEGEILVDGVVTSIDSPNVARALGLSTVFQELSLIPDLSLAENVQLQSRNGWSTSTRHRAEIAQEVATNWGLGRIAVENRVSTLSLRDQQIAEIICAVNRPHRVLVLDEPTSALLPADVAWLHSVIRTVIAEGSAVLIITHMLDEIERFCDEVYVQRNGTIVDHVQRASFDRQKVIEQMIGRSLESAYPPLPELDPEAEVLLDVRSISTRGMLDDVSLSIKAGEIVGIAGLDGQGQNEIFEALSGDRPITKGEVTLMGRRVKLTSPARALRPAPGLGGIALVPAERKTHGAILDLTIRKNVSLPILRRVGNALGLSDKAEQAVVSTLLHSVQVDPAKIDDPVRSLSGGNQQKVVFAKALAGDTDALLLFDPTRGVDVGTKHEIYKLITGYARSGKGVLMYSTEIPELVNVCHRVLVCYKGRLVAERHGAELDETSLMTAAIGVVQ
ncbi:sugar ABC transporter ATP-binding protein [Microbacteriaceae bacterium VKM Ac-2855]|nr:sugar ABC transporter ATP-binding protein [Microbacteriaceae bacterium VKM Ac-2855]